MEQNNIFNKIDFDYILDCLTEKMKEYLEREEQVIPGLMKPSYSVLELGSGTGRILKVSLPYAKRIIGIDNSEKQLEKARKNLKEYNNVELYCEDAKDLKRFSDREFDLVLGTFNFLGLFNDRDKIHVLKEVRRVLKGGECAFFTVYSENALAEQLGLYSKFGLKNIDYMDDYTLDVSSNNGTKLHSERFDMKRIGEIFDLGGFGNITIDNISDIAYKVRAFKDEKKGYKEVEIFNKKHKVRIGSWIVYDAGTLKGKERKKSLVVDIHPKGMLQDYILTRIENGGREIVDINNIIFVDS